MNKKLLSLILLFCFTVSCEYFSKGGNFDKWTDVRQKDFNDALFGVKKNYDDIDFDKTDTNLVISKLLSETPPPQIGNGELISFSITEDVPLKDVFIELGRLADIDIQVDPQINTGIIFKATEKPINVVIDKICELANLKYNYTDGILKVERDLPYTVNYELDALGEHELWGSIETSLKYILDIFPTTKQKAVVDEETTSNFEEDITEQKISINKPVGIISIFANKKAHKAIEKYIEQVKKNYGSQVLIEAKIVDISLNDSFSSGVDWSLFRNSTNAEGEIIKIEKFSSTSGFSSTGGIDKATFSIPVGKYTLNAIIGALSKFGQTRTLASPRVSALNNQKASLEFITPIVYFSVEKEEDGEDKDGNTKYTYNSEKQEDEEGVKLEITPTINYKTREITLKVKPELKNLTGYVEDPVNAGNKVPSVARRTIDTSLKIKSGEIMVIGGLIKDATQRSRMGIPFLKDIPILGYLFGYNSYSKETTETVIFIKATIVDNFEVLNIKDKKFLETFDISK